ncbi:MAG: hypothetical protein HZA22_04565 [Nitrospirae bacterium]|nr:hypothetical protein [Nitrospirota bacterium]
MTIYGNSSGKYKTAIEEIDLDHVVFIKRRTFSENPDRCDLIITMDTGDATTWTMDSTTAATHAKQFVDYKRARQQAVATVTISDVPRKRRAKAKK